MRRSGVVLVFALLAIVVLELLAISALGFARLAQAASRATVDAAALHHAAENAALAAAAGVDARAAARRLPGTMVDAAVPAAAGIEVSARIETLALGYQLIRARAQRARGAAVESAALVRVITDEALLSAFAASISTHEPLPDGAATSGDPAASCVDAVVMPVLVPRWRLLAPDDTLPLGKDVGVSWPDVERIADATAAAYEAPPQLIHLTGPLTLTGRLQGAISVDGDLTLAPGAAVHGLLTVRGTLLLLGDAEVTGAVRARAVAAGAANIRLDRCAIAAALEAPAFNRVYRPGPRWRLPAF